MSEAIKPSVDVDFDSSDELENVEAEQVSEPEEAAPSPEIEQEKTAPEPKSDDGEAEEPEGLKKYAARQKYKAEQAKRETEELRKKLEEYEQKMAKANEKPEPKVPEIPDQFDDDFQQKIAQRERALQERAAWEAEQRSIQQQRENLQLERQREEQARQQRESQDRAADYKQRISKSGLSEDDVSESLFKIQQEIPQLPEPMRLALLNDADSPLIAKYVAENPEDVYAMIGMDDYHAAVHIATKIKPKALKLKPKTSTAPEPPDQLDGGGKIEREPTHLQGTTYE